MPGLSPIILAKRMREYPFRLEYPSFGGKVIERDNCFLIAIPVFAYQMEARKLDNIRNIFFSTITDLAKIKRGDISDNGELYDYISQKTGLSRELVKSILQNEKLNMDSSTQKANPSSSHILRWIVYNPISGTFFPDSLSSEKYDRYTLAAKVLESEDGIELQVRLHESQRMENAFVVHSGLQEDKIIDPTSLLEKTPEIRQRLFKNIGKEDVWYTGHSERVYALCYCYLSPNDLSILHLSNPVGYGNIDAMMPSLLSMIKKQSFSNEDLHNLIDNLEMERKALLDAAGDWDQQLAEAENEIRLLYPKLAAHERILSRVTALTLSMRDVDHDNAIVAFHEFLEEMLLYSCQHFQPAGSDWEAYEKRCKCIGKTGDITELLVGFAEDAGFISSDEDRKIALKCFANQKPKAGKNASKLAPISDYESDCKVYGVTYNNTGANTESRQAIIHQLVGNDQLKSGVILQLVPETENPNDPDGIRVMGPDGRQVGTLPKNIACLVASRVKNGERYQAAVTGITGGNGFNYGIDIHIQGINNLREEQSKVQDRTQGFIRNSQLLRVLHGNAGSSYNLPELLAANMIQSVASPHHPFRAITGSCHDLIRTVFYSMVFRNPVKHGEENVKSFEAYVSMDVMERTMEALLAKVMNIEKLSDIELAEERNLRAGRQKAKIDAEEEMIHYPYLRTFMEGKPLERVCTDFFNKKDCYFATCSNLLDKLLMAVLSEHTELEQRKQTAQYFFTADKDSDAEKMDKLFADIGCRYQSDDRPNTGKIKGSWNSRTLTLKNKLFLCYATLYKYNRDYLNKIVQVAPEFPSITDYICIKRGHNNSAVFSESQDGYSSIHKKLLDCCERLYSIMNE